MSEREKRHRVVLSAEEFAGLKHIIENPEPPTPKARAAFAEYRAWVMAEPAGEEARSHDE